jgi:YesN/AraC family two-component response regulator
MKIVINEDEILTAEGLRHVLQSLKYGIEVKLLCLI